MQQREATKQVIYERFNEAAALLPRKVTSLADELRSGLIASMRPRHYCRGKYGAERGHGLGNPGLQ